MNYLITMITLIVLNNIAHGQEKIYKSVDCYSWYSKYEEVADKSEKTLIIGDKKITILNYCYDFILEIDSTTKKEYVDEDYTWYYCHKTKKGSLPGESIKYILLVPVSILEASSHGGRIIWLVKIVDEIERHKVSFVTN